MDKTEKLAELFKALSDPTRLKLVGLLNSTSPVSDRFPHQDVCKGGPLCVNALAHRIGVSQSAVSQHMRILKQAGLVRGERRGTFMHYFIDPDGLAKCNNALQEMLGTPETE
mgnify:CR=1 FL=1